jgi:hypothetical protein
VGILIKPALQVHKLRDLDLEVSEAVGPAFCSAASGLVSSGEELYVVADDELHLCRFALHASQPGERIFLFDGELPVGRKQRKKLKPDLEILLRLPAFEIYPHGALLALGSGSGAHRMRGALLALDAAGRAREPAKAFDAVEFFSALAVRFEDLNLEGGWVSAETLFLLQRGNKGDSRNAIVGLPLAPFLRALADASPWPAIPPTSMREVSLGDIDGIPLCFTDACALDDGSWIFTAVAEDTDNAWSDGFCAGAAVGMGDARGEVRWLRHLQPRYKVEGVEMMRVAGRNTLLMVTDADDPGRAASLLAAEI